MSLGPVTTRHTATTTKVRVELDPGRWDEVLAETRHDVSHTAGFQRFAAGLDHGDPCLIVVGDADRGMAWPYVLRRVDVVSGLTDMSARDVGSFHGYTGPVTWGLEPDDPFISEAFDHVLGVWREQGAISAFTRFHPLLGNAMLGSGRPAGREAVIEPLGETVSIDCSIGHDEAIAGYARVLRQEIARARRAGLVTEHDPEWVHLEKFVELYSDSMVRRQAMAAYSMSGADIRRMRDELDGCLHLFVTRLDGPGSTVIGAGVFSEYRGFVEAVMVGIDETYRRWSPLKVMLDDVRHWAHERGDSVLHLGSGRGGRRDSLFDFKRRFSGRRHVLYAGRSILDAASYGELVRLRTQRLADNGLGITDMSWFPAYRSPVSTLEAAVAGARQDPDSPAIPIQRERLAIPVSREPIPITISPMSVTTPADGARIPDRSIR